jgi:hypothetical protein
MEPDAAPEQMTPPAALPGGDKFAEAVLAQTEAILADKLFAKSPQLRRFLRFAVERTLAGDGMRLKEYTIAVEALGRPESFDARLDSIVRVEARRLREKLETYYDTKGASDRVLIWIEPGKYIPLFLDRVGAAAKPAVTLRIGCLESPEQPFHDLAAVATSLGYSMLPVASGHIAADAAKVDVLIASVSSEGCSRAIVSQLRGLLGACPGLVFVLSPESMRDVFAELSGVNAEWIVQPVRASDVEAAIQLAFHRHVATVNSRGAAALSPARSHSSPC